MNRLHSYSRQTMLLVAFVATAFAAGCGGGGGGGTPLAPGGGGGGTDTTAPTIVSTSPADTATDVCINQSVHASFDEAMDGAGITDTSFTVADALAAPVVGTVSYNATSRIATFNPDADLAANETYTATVVGGASGAKDSAGNALAADEVWTFTTGTCTAVLPVALGVAETFGAGSGAGITNQGLTTRVVGDLGASNNSSTITGLRDANEDFSITSENAGLVTGTIYTNQAPASDPGTIAGEVGPALNTANGELTGLAGTDPGADELGGLVLEPGVYVATSGSFGITGADLTLDAMGDPDAVWVFQMPAGSLTVGDTEARSVLLVNGAQAKNVFWTVGTTAAINAAGGGTMVGTIIAPNGVTISAPGNAEITTLDGRAFAFGGTIDMTNTVINVPAATVAPAPAPAP